MLRHNALHQATHALIRRLDLAEITNLTAASAIRDRNRVECLSNIASDKDLSAVSHD
jgi:hypothetical protein